MKMSSKKGRRKYSDPSTVWSMWCVTSHAFS